MSFFKNYKKSDDRVIVGTGKKTLYIRNYCIFVPITPILAHSIL